MSLKIGYQGLNRVSQHPDHHSSLSPLCSASPFKFLFEQQNVKIEGLDGPARKPSL